VQIGEQIGEQRGVQIGEQIGEQRGRQAAGRSLILRLLTRRVGPVPNRSLEQINQLSLAQIETLGEALLDFQTMTDLTTWLAQHQPRGNP
jgi:predicted transposase YdaD